MGRCCSTQPPAVCPQRWARTCFKFQLCGYFCALNHRQIFFHIQPAQWCNNLHFGLFFSCSFPFLRRYAGGRAAAARRHVKRHIRPGKSDGYFCTTSLRADLGSCKVFVKAVKSQLSEGCKTLPGAGTSPAWLRGPKAGAQRSLATLRFWDALSFLLLPLQKSERKVQSRRAQFELKSDCEG